MPVCMGLETDVVDTTVVVVFVVLHVSGIAVSSLWNCI